MTATVSIHKPHDPGIQMTEAAISHVLQQISKRGQGIGLRLSIKTTGCSGYSYVVDLIETATPGDWVSHINEQIAVYVDPEAVAKLRGTQIDYVREGLNTRFEFINPNEQSRCGCGESFST